MTRISIIRKPYPESGYNPGDPATLPQSMAQRWITEGVAVWVSGEACEPGPVVEVEFKETNIGCWRRRK